jgi:hypothetical protein
MIVNPDSALVSTHIRSVSQMILAKRVFEERLADIYANELRQIIDHLRSKNVDQSLRDLRFIPVRDESGTWTLAPPTNILLNSSDEDRDTKLFPYLVTFSHVHRDAADTYFLRDLGAIKRSNPDCYLKALNAIAESVSGQIIDDPDELGQIHIAYDALIDLLQTNPFDKDPAEAHFLGTDNCMHPSNEVTLIDTPEYRESLLESGADVVVFLQSTNSAAQKDKNAFGRLPKHLRPKLLSSHLRLLLDNDLEDADGESETASYIR